MFWCRSNKTIVWILALSALLLGLPGRKKITLNTLGKNFSRPHFEIFFLIFFQKIGFDTSCKLSPYETVCMKCQSLFSGKNKKNIINLSTAEFAQRMVIAVKPSVSAISTACLVMFSKPGKNFSRKQFKIHIFSSIFARKQDLAFHANCLPRRQFAWNVHAYFLGRKKYFKLLLNVLPSMLSIKWIL